MTVQERCGKGAISATLIGSGHYLLLYSSYRYNAQADENPLATPHFPYHRLDRNTDTRRSVCRRLYRACPAQVDIDRIREAIWALGRCHFREKIEALPDRRASLQDRDHPRKDAIDTKSVHLEPE